MQEEGVDPLSGIVSVVCIPGRGLWKVANVPGPSKRIWQRLNHNDENSHIAWFVGCMSNSCYELHAQRQGRDPKSGLECGIGMYIPGGDAWVTAMHI